MPPVFLGLDEALEIHRDQIERYGGSSGVRDMGLLQSALAVLLLDHAERHAAGEALGQVLQADQLGDDQVGLVAAGPLVDVAQHAQRAGKVPGAEDERIEAGDGDEQFKLISDLAFGPDGDLYVTDKLKAKIFNFDASGKFKRTIGRRGDNIDELVRPKGIAIDRENRIWVVCAGVSIGASVWSTEVVKIYD